MLTKVIASSQSCLNLAARQTCPGVFTNRLAAGRDGTIALKLGVSAPVTDDRIVQEQGPEAAI
jgi:hypothetical protein